MGHDNSQGSAATEQSPVAINVVPIPATPWSDNVSVSERWIGHKNTAMLFKRYAKWIDGADFRH
jgi:hypothetical protein